MNSKVEPTILLHCMISHQYSIVLVSIRYTPNAKRKANDKVVKRNRLNQSYKCMACFLLHLSEFNAEKALVNKAVKQPERNKNKRTRQSKQTLYYN